MSNKSRESFEKSSFKPPGFLSLSCPDARRLRAAKSELKEKGDVARGGERNAAEVPRLQAELARAQKRGDEHRKEADALRGERGAWAGEKERLEEALQAKEDRLHTSGGARTLILKKKREAKRDCLEGERDCLEGERDICETPPPSFRNPLCPPRRRSAIALHRGVVFLVLSLARVL